MKKIFGVLLVPLMLSACSLLFPNRKDSSTSSLSSSSSTTSLSTSNSSKGDVYKLNATNVTVEVGGTYQFHLYKNNALVTNNVLWQVSTDLLSISSTGLLTGIYPTSETTNAFVRGSVDNHYVDCPVTVIGRDSPIYRCMTTQYQSSAEIKDTNHVIYSCTKTDSGSNWDGTKYKNTYSLEYDSLTNECLIQIIKIGYYVNGDGYQWEEIFSGYNKFTWGNYENGQFYGIMGDIVHTNPEKERQVNVIFNNNYLVFDKNQYDIGVYRQQEYYQIQKNTYTDYTVKETDIYEILKTVINCKNFADDEVFKAYNNSHPNDLVKLF